jgi:hypothetical protein
VLREREPLDIVRSSVVCKGQVTSHATGCVGRGEKEREGKEDLIAESADKKCMFYLNKS